MTITKKAMKLIIATIVTVTNVMTNGNIIVVRNSSKQKMRSLIKL